jgi:hypothetical protein
MEVNLWLSQKKKSQKERKCVRDIIIKKREKERRKNIVVG